MATGAAHKWLKLDSNTNLERVIDVGSKPWLN